MNSKEHANTQNSLIHLENNVYRYIKAKTLVTSTYVFENIMHELHTVLLLQALFFHSEHTTHSLSVLPGKCVRFLLAEGG